MATSASHRQSFPWNKGKLVGQKAPLKLREIWAIRVRLQLNHKVRDLALFNLAIDSKLRACDLVGLHVTDVAHGDKIGRRAIVMQRKTHRPVQFEITEMTGESLLAWIQQAQLGFSKRNFDPRTTYSPVEDDLRCPHQRLATVLIARILEGQAKEGRAAIGAMLNHVDHGFD